MIVFSTCRDPIYNSRDPNGVPFGSLKHLNKTLVKQLQLLSNVINGFVQNSLF